MTASARLRLFYGVGSVGTGIFTTVPSILLLYFLTVEAHIDAAVAGIVILVPKLVGLVGDPVVGTWSDRLQQRTRSGRQVLMSVGALLAGTGLWALFTLPRSHPGEVLVPAAIFLLCTTGYSLFAVPYSALPAELDRSEAGRRLLVSTRLGLSFLGVLIGGVTAPAVAARYGYPAMGAMMGLVCIAAMAAFLLTCPIPRTAPTPMQRDRADVAHAKLMRSGFAIQMASFMPLLAAAGTASALLPFIAHDFGASTEVVGYAILVNIIVALLTSLVWPIVIRRAGLRTAWILAAICQGLGAVVVGTAPALGFQFYLGMAIAGAALSGVQIAGFTGLADLTADHLQNGRTAGLMTGLWMAGEKAGLASGPLLAGIGLQFLGATAFGSAARSSLTIIPAGLAVIAILIVLFGRKGTRAARGGELQL